MDVSASVQHLVDDVWDEDDEGAERRIAEASLKQVEQAQYAAGYQRGYDDATSSTNTKLVQHGFDDGYQLGLMLGRLYAQLVLRNPEREYSQDEIKHIKQWIYKNLLNELLQISCQVPIETCMDKACVMLKQFISTLDLQ